MIEMIRDYYLKYKVPSVLLDAKLEKFERNPDVAEEFNHWIETGHYRNETEAVIIDGYTAKSFADMSEYLDGDGAFLLLIEMREDKDKALRRIANGFKLK